MNTIAEKSNAQATVKKNTIPVIDCDVHPNPRSYEDLNPYLSDYWRDFLTDCKWKGVFPGIPIMAIVANAGHRMDSIPPEGGLGCSSLSFYKEQVADRYNYANSILFPDSTFMLSASPQHEMATAVASAYNDWQIEHWLSKDPVSVVLLSLLHRTLLKQHVRLIASEATHKWFKLVYRFIPRMEVGETRDITQFGKLRYEMD